MYGKCISIYSLVFIKARCLLPQVTFTVVHSNYFLLTLSYKNFGTNILQIKNPKNYWTKIRSYLILVLKFIK